MLPRPVPSLSLHNIHSPKKFLTQNSVNSSTSTVFSSKNKLMSLVPRISNLSQQTHSTIDNRCQVLNSLKKFKSVVVDVLNDEFQKNIIASDINGIDRLFVTISKIHTRRKLVFKKQAFQKLLNSQMNLPITPIKQRTQGSGMSSGDIVSEMNYRFEGRFENSLLIKIIEKKTRDYSTLLLCRTLDKIICQNKRFIISLLNLQQDVIKMYFILCIFSENLKIYYLFTMLLDKKQGHNKQLVIQNLKRLIKIKKTLQRFKTIFENKVKVQYYQFILTLLATPTSKGFSLIKITTQKSLEIESSLCQQDTSRIELSKNEISSKEKVAIQLASITWVNYFIEKKILTQQHHFLSRIMVTEIQLQSQVSILQEPKIPMSPFDKALSTVSSHSSTSLKKITLTVPDDYSPANQLFARMYVPQRNSLKFASPVSNKISQGTKQMVESLRRKNMPLLEKVKSDGIVISSKQCLSEEYISSKKKIQTQNGFEFLQVNSSPKNQIKKLYNYPSNLDIRIIKADETKSLPKIIKKKSNGQSKLLHSVKQYVQNSKSVDEKDQVIQFDNTKSQKKQLSLFLPSLQKNSWIVKDLKSPENDNPQRNSIERFGKPGLTQQTTEKVVKKGLFQQSIQQVIQEALLQEKYKEIIVTHNKFNLLSTFLLFLFLYLGFQYINDII